MIADEHVERIGKGAYPETARKLAEKWGDVFGVPPSWIVSHAWVESRNRPKAMNPGGPAYGMMQMKMGAAGDVAAGIASLVRRCRKSPDGDGCPADVAAIAKVLKLWRGRGEDLFNPELAVMFSAYYLSVLIHKLGEYGNDQKIVAASYNQGRGAVMNAIKAGKMTVPMKHYIAQIEEAKENGFA